MLHHHYIIVCECVTSSLHHCVCVCVHVDYTHSLSLSLSPGSLRRESDHHLTILRTRELYKLPHVCLFTLWLREEQLHHYLHRVSMGNIHDYIITKLDHL